MARKPSLIPLIFGITARAPCAPGPRQRIATAPSLLAGNADARSERWQHGRRNGGRSQSRQS